MTTTGQAGETVQQAKALAAKPDDLCSMSTEGEEVAVVLVKMGFADSS